MLGTARNDKIFTGDDQDLDDRVIKKLWEENQELRDQVNLLRNGQTQADEGQWSSSQ